MTKGIITELVGRISFFPEVAIKTLWLLMKRSVSSKGFTPEFIHARKVFFFEQLEAIIEELPQKVYLANENHANGSISELTMLMANFLKRYCSICFQKSKTNSATMEKISNPHAMEIEIESDGIDENFEYKIENDTLKSILDLICIMISSTAGFSLIFE